MRGRRLEGGGERHTFHIDIVFPQERIGPVLDPPCYVRVRRPAIRRIVFEPAVLGRIVRRRDDDAVRQPVLAVAVVDEDGPRNHRRGRHPVVGLDDGPDIVGGEHFERGALGRTGQRVRVLAHDRVARRCRDRDGSRRWPG